MSRLGKSWKRQPYLYNRVGNDGDDVLLFFFFLEKKRNFGEWGEA